MIVTYDVYRRYSKRDQPDANQPIEDDIYYGKRYELIADYESFTLNLNWAKKSKFSIRGKSVGTCPLVIGD